MYLLKHCNLKNNNINHLSNTKLYDIVETAKKLWASLRDPFRKLEMTRTVGGAATSDESKKSGARGMSVQDKATSWAYYDKMSFLRPYIYTKQ